MSTCSKSFNYAQGHTAGDAALAEAGESSKGEPIIDTVSRIGGDEFAAILPKTDEHVRRHLAGRLSDVSGRASRNHDEVGLAALIGLNERVRDSSATADQGSIVPRQMDVLGAAPSATSVLALRPASRESGVARSNLQTSRWDRLEESLRESNRATTRHHRSLTHFTRQIDWIRLRRPRLSTPAHQLDARCGQWWHGRRPDRPKGRRCRSSAVAVPRAHLPACHRQR